MLAVSCWQCAHCLMRLLALTLIAKTRMQLAFARCVGTVSSVSTTFHGEGEATQASAARRGRGAVQPFTRLDYVASYRTNASTKERVNTGAVCRLLTLIAGSRCMPPKLPRYSPAPCHTGRNDPAKTIAVALPILLTVNRCERRSLDI